MQKANSDHMTTKESVAISSFFERLRQCLSEHLSTPKVSPQLPEIDVVELKKWLDHLHSPLEQQQARGLFCNPWQVAKLGRNEVRHTAVLSWLLNPSGDHGLGNVLLTRLLCWVNRAHPNMPTVPDGLVTVIPEARLDDAGKDRVDIVLRCRSGSAPFCLMIEAKIDSMEGKEQIKRYRQAASRMPEKTSCILFLTTDGRNSNTAGEDDKIPVVALSWRHLSRLLLSELKLIKPEAPGYQSLGFMLAETYLRYIRDF